MNNSAELPDPVLNPPATNIPNITVFDSRNKRAVCYLHEGDIVTPPPGAICLVHANRGHYTYLRITESIKTSAPGMVLRSQAIQEVVQNIPVLEMTKGKHYSFMWYYFLSHDI